MTLYYTMLHNLYYIGKGNWFCDDIKLSASYPNDFLHCDDCHQRMYRKQVAKMQQNHCSAISEYFNSCHHSNLIMSYFSIFLSGYRVTMLHAGTFTIFKITPYITIFMWLVLFHQPTKWLMLNSFTNAALPL